ncbi:MAG TPA: FHA domain-containing protein [Polyangiaceae bacterium]|nr:FHA domain-containing protein [Polyangiaceae bacterium]
MSTGEDRRPTGFCLRIGSRAVRLHTGSVLVGRGLSSDVVLDDSQVSRQHARLDVSEDAVTVVDLGSVNGSYLDDQPLARGPTPVPVGARLRFGHTSLELVVEPPAPSGARAQRALELRGEPLLVLGEEDIPTRRYQALDVAGAGAELEYAAGRPDQAERLLAGYLANVLDELTSRRPLPEQTVLEAARLALRLAAKTSKARWFDFAVDMLQHAEGLPRAEMVAELSEVGRGLAIDRARLARYVEDRARRGGEAARRRLSGLSTLAANEPVIGGR